MLVAIAGTALLLQFTCFCSAGEERQLCKGGRHEQTPRKIHKTACCNIRSLSLVGFMGSEYPNSTYLLSKD